MFSVTIDQAKIQLRTLLVAVTGAVIYSLTDLPLPFLFGPMIACLLMALMGCRLIGFHRLSTIARTILGVAIGATITPDLLQQIPQMAISVAFIPLYILVIGITGVWYFHKVCRLDPVTSYYAAMPGGLQDMVFFGIESGGNGRALSLIHATRIMLIVIIVPVYIHFWHGVDFTDNIGEPATNIPLTELLLMILAAISGWRAAQWLGMFGASLLGPMIATAALSISGLLHIRPPNEAIAFAQLFIGIGIGVLYVGITLRELRQVVVSGIGYALILILIAAAFTWLVTSIDTGIGRVEALMAFSPGGQAEMTLLAISSGSDSGYIILHHIARLVLVISCAPVAAALLKRWLVHTK